jgi:outer membrane protein TolC
MRKEVAMGSMRRCCSFKSVFLLLVFAGVFVPASAYPAENVVLSLDDCIKRAVKVNAEIKEAEFEVEVYKSKKAQADAARFPQVELVAYGSLSPRARLIDGHNGNVESSTNINRPSYDGVFGKVDMQLIQPIYTFGKISAYRAAASHGVEAYKAGAKLKATEVELLVKEAYYGLLLGRELQAFLADIKGQLDGAIDKTQSQLDADAPEVDQVDLLKLQTFQGELGKYIAVVDEGTNKAYFGLKLLVGLEDDKDELQIADEYLIPADVSIESYEMYRDAAMKQRLEFKQLKEGLLAKENLIKAGYADYFPQVFVAVVYSLAGATNRDHLNNPYITDEFNHAYGGAVLGFKWGFDFGIRNGRVSEARAEYMKLKMKEYYAEGGVPFQVKEAYLQLVRSTEEMKSLMSAYQNAKQWVVTTTANFDLGVGEGKDLADAVFAYARIRADYFRSVFNQRMAIANLEHATGKDAAESSYSSPDDPMKELKKLEDEYKEKAKGDGK